MKQKNVVFIVTDDQRFNTIHELGNQEISTPNLDWLVRHGTCFTQAHIPSGTCGAVCMPSRAMIHTGRTLFHLKEEGQEIPEEHVTLGEVLQKNDYRTCGIGKWHNGTESYARSFTDGGDIFFGGMWDHWHVPVSHYDSTGKYDNMKKYTTNFQQKNTPMEIHCDELTIGVHSTDLFTEKALEKLEELGGQKEDQPFFLYLSYLAPHDPRTMPEEYQNLYPADRIPLPASFVSTHPFEIGIESIRAEHLAAYPRKEQEIRQHIADYYAMISHLDYNVGLLLRKLEEMNLWEDTLIIFTGDNGLAVGSHGYMAKQSHYEHSIRVPLMMAGAGIPEGKRIDSYVYLLDIYPTVCQWLGIEIPDSVEGIGMKPLIDGSASMLRESLYFAYEDLIRSVKWNGYKLIRYQKAPDHPQLFCVDRDPDETDNLYGREQYDQIVQNLDERMREYRRTWEDTGHRFSISFWEN